MSGGIAAAAERRPVRFACDSALLLALFAGPAAALETVIIDIERIEQETVFDGVLEAVNRSTVAAQTSARVEEIHFDVGDYVEKGTTIIRFRDSEQRARLESAAASLREARARLADAEANHVRVKEVFDRGLLPKAALDTATADLNAARARSEAARAAVDEATEGLSHTLVRAPYSGIVEQRHIETGETATVGRPLMTGLSLEHLRAVVDIPQQHIAPLRAHRQSRVILPDGNSLPAHDLRIPPNADPATHTFRVLVSLPEGSHGVFPGMLVKVAFTSGAREELLVPAAALVRRSEVTAVYVAGDDGSLQFRYVRAGTPAADGRIPILAGLAAGERVALDPIAAGVAYREQAGR
jgi:RND family efflux transporter MFP subunit